MSNTSHDFTPWRQVRVEGGRLIRQNLLGSHQLNPEDLANDKDPGLFGPDSVAWKLHADPSLLIGALRALLLQTLHPLVLAGVVDHSTYQQDPTGRLQRTASFVGTTIYANTTVAQSSIDLVKAIHSKVKGTAPDGRSYSATDPHLLLWVHVTEVDSFLAAYRRYGSAVLTKPEKDRYVAEMAQLAIALGTDPDQTPRTVLQLKQCLDNFKPECSFNSDTKEAVRFLIAPPIPWWAIGGYSIVASAATVILPRWARYQLRLPVPPGSDRLLIWPSASVLTRTLGWFLGAEPQLPDIVDPVAA